MEEKKYITINTTVKAPIDTVWRLWNEPEHIKRWNTASEDWHTTYAENDLRVGGKFLSRMEAKDGSFGFDFGGIYDQVRTNELIAYTLGDNRTVKITFQVRDQETEITEVFEAENENPVDMQRLGWQSILDNFNKYTQEVR
jgi:Uncharacterized conserved protein